MVSRVYDMIYMLVKTFIPLKTYRTSTFPNWFNFQLRNLIVSKKLAHRKFKQKYSQMDYTHFANSRFQCEAMHKTSFEQYINKPANNLSNNP